MAVAVMMPVITASGEEAVVTAWFVDEGGACKEGQLIAEVQAEKVSEEVEAPQAGFVVNRVGINDPVPQGSPICSIAETTSQQVSVPAAAPEAGTEVSPTRVTASPSAKRVARELGVELTTVAGTGPGGRITESDVRAAAHPAAPPTGGLRTVIARNMRRSHAETAPVTLHTTVDLGAERPAHITATMVKTVAESLAGHPHLNGHRQDDQFISADVAHIAIAIQTDEGLVAPVIRDPASKTADEIEATVRDLAERATAKTLTAADYEGGTFTISNLGVYGIDGFTPIINLPQVAILGVGAIRQVPAIDEEGSLAASHQMVLSLTFDHAFVDGAPAAAFLQEVEAALGG